MVKRYIEDIAFEATAAPLRSVFLASFHSKRFLLSRSSLILTKEILLNVEMKHRTLLFPFRSI